MKFTTDRESLLKPLQLVTGVVERRQTLPVLSNLLVVAKAGSLSFTGTDLEVELVVNLSLDSGVTIEDEGEITIPARKLADIWRSLPEGAKVTVQSEGDRTIVRSGRSRFSLATLPAADFPKVEGGADDVEVRMPQPQLIRLLNQVGFSMAQQDVRYFLNGMLLEFAPGHARTVATDGHRLAMCTVQSDRLDGLPNNQRVQAIVPRKGILELGRILDEKADTEADDVLLQLGKNHLRVNQGPYTLTTKLVDGKFPDYEKVVPKDASRTISGDRETLRQAFHRAAILSNEKYRGVRLIVDQDQLTVQANNPEQEEAEEIVAVEYSGTALEIGFNVSYLQDVLGALDGDEVRLSVSDANSSALIEGPANEDALYVVMPMRL